MFVEDHILFQFLAVGLKNYTTLLSCANRIIAFSFTFQTSLSSDGHCSMFG